MDYNGLLRSITKSFVSHIESHAFMTRTCLATILHIVCVCFNNESVPFQRWDPHCLQMKVCGSHSFSQRVAPIYPEKQFLREKNLHRSPGNGTFFLPSCTVLVSAPTTFCPDLSVLTTGCPDLSRLGFGICWFDWKTSRWLHNLSFWSLSTV